MPGFEALQALVSDENFWQTPLKDAKIADCRAFAARHKLKLPKGVRQRKAAFIFLFKICGLTPESLIKLRDTELTDEERNALFRYKNTGGNPPTVSVKGRCTSEPVKGKRCQNKTGRPLSQAPTHTTNRQRSSKKNGDDRSQQPKAKRKVPTTVATGNVPPIPDSFLPVGKIRAPQFGIRR